MQGWHLPSALQSLSELREGHPPKYWVDAETLPVHKGQGFQPDSGTDWWEGQGPGGLMGSGQGRRLWFLLEIKALSVQKWG